MFDGIVSMISSLLGKKDRENEKIAKATNPVVEGTQGRIEAESLVLKQGDHLIMVIDYDLGDMPSWIEWDIGTSLMYIIQSGGSVAQMEAIIPPEEASQLEKFKRLILVTKVGEEKVTHMVPFLIKIRD